MKHPLPTLSTFLCLLLGLPFYSYAQEAPASGAAPTTEAIEKKTYLTARIKDKPPVINGVFDDPAWNQVEWASDFTQREPNSGAAPSQQTAFKVLYDDKNIYFAIRAYDSEPEKIARRMSRRDGFQGDMVEINLDSYFDLRTAFSFTVSASGVIGDEAVSNDGNDWDSSWDPIWWARTKIDEQGWTAEVRIPLSQLRFGKKESMVWGLQVTRIFFRNDERSNWQYIPQNSPGWVHLFGQLHGLDGIKPQKQLEVMPYVVAKTETSPSDAENPYLDGKDQSVTFGVDGKVGITSDITLDFTINPDFGQVEADPSQVNLSAFEVFFQEQRPFFIESRNILDYNLSNSVAGGPFNTDNLFYSRRVGRNPQYYPDTDHFQRTDDGVNEYVDQPTNTTILGALKLTGKGKTGFSFGIMESITQEEVAEIDSLGFRRNMVAEPLTNYLVMRAQQDFNKGNTIVGAIFSATNRFMPNDSLMVNLPGQVTGSAKISEYAHLKDRLHTDAYSAGADFKHNWKDRKYFVEGRLVVSHVRGSKEALLNTQTNSRHYFQRPDAFSLSVDSTLTSMTGTGGMLKVGKSGGGNIRYETGVTWRSPQLELNDLGFMRKADDINQWTWIGLQQNQPFGIFRRAFLNFNQYASWDFDGDFTYFGVNANARAQFNNFWWAGAGISPDMFFRANNDLRGGPAFVYPGSVWSWFWINSDSRKKLQVNFGLEGQFSEHDYAKNINFWMYIRYRPIDALELILNPFISQMRNELQYIDSFEVEGQQPETRYVLGHINQKTMGITFRVNWILRPNLTVQYYGQPFGSTGSYSSLKYVTNSTDSDYTARFAKYAQSQHHWDNSQEQFVIDHNQDGTVDYSGNPNYSFGQFRHNMVLRWEYIPGSTFFLVWAVNGNGGANLDFRPNQFNASINDLHATNTFLMKYTYRFRL